MWSTPRGGGSPPSVAGTRCRRPSPGCGRSPARPAAAGCLRQQPASRPLARMRTTQTTPVHFPLAPAIFPLQRPALQRSCCVSLFSPSVVGYCQRLNNLLQHRAQQVAKSTSVGTVGGLTLIKCRAKGGPPCMAAGGGSARSSGGGATAAAQQPQLHTHLHSCTLTSLLGRRGVAGKPDRPAPISFRSAGRCRPHPDFPHVSRCGHGSRESCMHGAVRPPCRRRPPRHRLRRARLPLAAADYSHRSHLQCRGSGQLLHIQSPSSNRGAGWRRRVAAAVCCRALSGPESSAR